MSHAKQERSTARRESTISSGPRAQIGNILAPSAHRLTGLWRSRLGPDQHRSQDPPQIAIRMIVNVNEPRRMHPALSRSHPLAAAAAQAAGIRHEIERRSRNMRLRPVILKSTSRCFYLACLAMIKSFTLA